MNKRVLALIGFTSGVGMAAVAGCGAENKLDVVVEEGATAQHPNLPAVPTLPPPPFPVNYPDNAFSIYGLRHVAQRNWQKQVPVRGYVVDVYVPYVPGTNPPRVCTERDRCLEERPHVYIADTANETDRDKWMMVTGYAMHQSEIDQARTAARNHAAPAPTPAGMPAPPTIPTDFNVGAKVTVTGVFQRTADNGQADSNGLLTYRSHVTDQAAPAPTRH